MNHIEIPEEYKYILDRYGFECLRAVGNASFMLYKHINDKDASYLESDEWKKLVDKTENAYDENELTIQAVIYKLTGGYDIPKWFRIGRENEDLYYIDNSEDNEEVL